MNDDRLLGDTREYLICDNAACAKIDARMRCGGCGLHYYCQKSCQRAAWREHKAMCQHFRNMKQDNEAKIATILEEVDMPADEESEQTIAGEDANVCAICLEIPTVPIELDCNHAFCYECLVERIEHAIVSGTVPRPIDKKLQNWKCPICRAATLPFDTLGCVIDEAAVYSNRANLIMQHRKRLAPYAASLADEAHTKAAAVLDRAMEVATEDPFYPNLVFKRAELASSMEDYDLGATLMAESTASFQDGGRHSYMMDDSNGRLNFYNHFRLQAHCLLGAGRASEAMVVLQTGARSVENDMGTNPKIDRDFYADFTRCLYELGQHEQAIEIGWDLVIEMNRTYAQCHKYVALSQKAVGRLDDAVTTMRQAVCYETPWDEANVDEARELLTQLLSDAASLEGTSR